MAAGGYAAVDAALARLERMLAPWTRAGSSADSRRPAAAQLLSDVKPAADANRLAHEKSGGASV
ncbi:hypothetical protein DAD99_13535 [Pseudarthrobacter sp. AB1]|nr:hypothetical protein [Pseudarthrobacter sp. AB1]